MMVRNWRRHDFDSRQALADALAATVGDQLREAITQKGLGTLAVSGGSTPTVFLDTLSRIELDWDKVAVTLVDERFVDETSARSNAALVRSRLLRNQAAKARFVPLYRPNLSLEEAAAAASIAIRRLDLPLDVAVLGMGNDGHTASFFPDAAELERLLDPATEEVVAAVHAASAGEDRLTMTVPVIAAARFTALHIEGAEKASTLAAALKPGAHLPIRRVIDAAQTPVEIFWAA